MKNTTKTNRIIYLSVLAGMVYLFITFHTFSRNWESIKHGWQAGKNSQEALSNQHDAVQKVYFVKTKSRGGFQHFPEQILNNKTDAIYPARYSGLEVAIPQNENVPAITQLSEFIQGFTITLAFTLFLMIPFVFVNLIRSLYKNQVFNKKNIKRTRNLGVIIISLYFSTLGFGYSSYRINKAMFSFEDYEHVFHFQDNYLLMMGVALLLTAEILSGGLSLKEDQDLTI